jgi:DNA-binding XRE family transcriptional regulator
VVRVDEMPVGGLNEAADLEERCYLEGAPRYNGQRHLRYPSQHTLSPRRLNVGRHFGDKLKYERIAQTLTQRQLAKMAGISHVTLVNIERNQVDPHVSTIRRLADALGVEPRELLPR